MQFAIDLPPFGPFSDPRLVSDLAHEAEDAGWHGFYLWDHINYKLEESPESLAIADPWIQLAAIAVRTKTIKLGTMVTPLARRRPWKLARETVTLDHLSDGRLIVGVGLGGDGDGEYSSFGEPEDARMHGAMLDEALAVLTRLWSGEEVSYQGQHYQLSHVRFLPIPVQTPRIPIWVAGIWPHKKPCRRAAQFDGAYPQAHGRALTPEDYREILAFIQSQRAQTAPFAMLTRGRTSRTDRAADAEHVAAYGQAGVTWWLEQFRPQHTLDEVRQRIQHGPPRF